MSILKPFAWMSNPQYLAQAGHVLGGCLLIVLTALFTLAMGVGWSVIWAVFGFGVIAATVKEFVVDLLPEPYGEGDSFSDSLMDWCFYMLGGVVGLGLAAWAFHLVPTPPPFGW
jgi:hypothetical protein